MRLPVRIALILLCAIAVTAPSFAQDSLDVDAILKDADDKTPLAYATVYNRSSNNGTVTNIDGYFRLVEASATDTISISYLGYQSKEFIAEDLVNREEVFLEKRSELIGEVIIQGDNTYLYNLLHACSKNRSSGKRTAKTYFTLQTNVADTQIEMVECYYNADVHGYDLDELHLKNGRLAIQSYANKYFVSTETSKVVSMYDVFDKNRYFPRNPLDMGKGRMKRNYDLTLLSRYADEAGSTIYVIDFEPSKKERQNFSGTAWVDSVNQRLVKLDLEIEDALLYPMLPIWESDELLEVSMDISKTFEEIDGEMFMRSTDFDYQLKYKHRDGSVDDISTSAVLYAYDFNDQFTIPFFDFADSNISDYRKINAFPYNAFFWENFNEFELNDLNHRNERFIRQGSTMSNQTLFVRNDLGRRGFLEQPFVHWNGNRVTFKTGEESKREIDALSRSFGVDRYTLKAQVFMDINEIGDSLQVVTSTVFDPYQSFFYFELNQTARAFINIYFDLVEIERRKLMEEVAGMDSKDDIIAAYERCKRQIEYVTHIYFDDVQHGTDEHGMERWNEVVKRHLGIDNIMVFGIYDADE